MAQATPKFFRDQLLGLIQKLAAFFFFFTSLQGLSQFQRDWDGDSTITAVDSVVTLLDSALRAAFPYDPEPSDEGTTRTLKILYDGDIIQSELVIYGKDTCPYMQYVLNGGTTSAGYDDYTCLHDGVMLPIYRCASEIPEKDQSDVEYHVQMCDINARINEYDSLVFRLASSKLDSIIFTYIGSDELRSVIPVPSYFKDNKIIWTKNEFVSSNEYTEVKIIFYGRSETFLDFSRIEIQNYNQQIEFWLGNIPQCILFALPFWILWLLVYSNRRHLSSASAELVNTILRWIPILSSFYFLLIVLDIYASVDSTIDRIGITSDEQGDFRIQTRIVGALFAGTILIVCHLLRKKDKPWFALLRRVFSVFAWCIIAFPLLGVINYCYHLFLPLEDEYWILSESLDLHVYFRYPFGVVIPVSVFLFICFYKLFKSDRTSLYISFLALVIFLTFQAYIAFDTLFSDTAGTNILGIFVAHYILLAFIPLCVAGLLLTKIIKSDPGIKVLASLGTFYILFFCFYSVYPGTIFTLPSAFILAYFIGKSLFANSGERLALVMVGQRIVEMEKHQKNLFKKFFEIRQLEGLKEIYTDRFLSGELRKSEKDQAISELNYPEGFNDKLTKRAVVERLKFGIGKNYLEHASKCSLTAFLVTIVLFSFYFKMNYTSFSGNQNDLLDVFLPALKFAIAAYCMGLFFPFITGNSGWKKGFYFALAITAAELPYQYMTSQTPIGLLLITPLMKEVLVFTLTGFIIDVWNIKRMYGTDFKVKYVVQIEGWKNIVWFGSIIASAIIAAIVAMLSEGLGTILSDFPK